MELDRLVEDYRAAAERHGSATQQGDYETANESHDRLHQIVVAIGTHGEEGRRALHELMKQEKVGDHVRLWAATHLLVWAPETAQKTLEDVVTKGGVVGFSARMVLREWQAGRLKPQL